MPGTTGGRPSSGGGGRSNYKPPRSRKPASQGHPSQGGSTVGGGTGGRPPKKYRSPAPTSQGGHPGRGSSGTAGGTKKGGKPTKYKTRTQSVRRQRAEARRERRELMERIDRLERSLRGSKAARSTLTADERRDIDVSAALDELKRERRHLSAGMSDLDLGDLATPAVKVLDQLTRVGEGAAAGWEDQIKQIKGEKDFDPLGPAKAAFKSGVTREKRRTFSDTLRTAGVEGAIEDATGSKKVAKTLTDVGGLAADILLDPLTYTTFGVAAPGTVAGKAAIRAGAKAEAKALRSGMSKTQARKAGKAAAHRAYKKAPKNRGLTVGFAGKQTSGKSTATVGRAIGVPGAARMVTGTPAAEAIRRNLPIKPADISEKEWNALKAADRERRGLRLHETRRTARKARAIRKATGGTYRRLLPERDVAGGDLRVLPRRRKPAPAEASAKIRDAIERLDFDGLTAKEKQAAEAFMDEQERIYQLRVEAGENPPRYAPREAGEPEGYAARQAMLEIDDRGTRRQIKRSGQPLRDPAERGDLRSPFRQPSKRTTTLRDFERGERRPVAEVREESPSMYVEDLETTLRAKAQKDIGRAANTPSLARSHFAFFSSGRPVVAITLFR